MIAGKFLDPKNDFAFKKIFGTEKNKDILVHFLNDILSFKKGEEIKNVTHTQENEPALIAGDDFIIKQAYEVLNQFSWSEEERNTYEREKKSELDARELLSTARNEGIALGKLEGIALGKLEGIKETARKMLAQGIDIQTVVVVTGLSEQEIQNFT